MKIEQLDLLEKLFKRVKIPVAVYQKLTTNQKYTHRLAADMRFRLNSTSNRGIVVEMTWVLTYTTARQ